MLIGIDIGGTYTDGILFSNGAVVHSVKQRTNDSDLKETLLTVLDGLLAQAPKGSIERLVLSTTLVTNLLATGRTERTALLLTPGSGLPFSAYGKICPDTYFLKGSIDFRGREIEGIDEGEIQEVLQKIESTGIRRVAVAGKFSNRNDGHETAIKEMILSRYPYFEVCTSNVISGQLNFPRRAVTCYYTAMTIREWNHFADAIEVAIASRIPGCDLHILKADGGTSSLHDSRKRPCETMFSGPAASTVGAMALCREPLNSVMVDIGGTTTDLCLLIDGRPLYASRGGLIDGRLTHIRAFAVDSVALGGDSPITVERGEAKIGVTRLGPAACFGGEVPTVTDVFNVLMNLDIGNGAASRRELTKIADRLEQPLEGLCRTVARHVLVTLQSRIDFMFKQWENEPAYKVWEVVHKRKFNLHQLIGIGAACSMIVPELAKNMKVNWLLHRYSPVANALGAALARPTLSVEVHLDTEKRVCTISPGGLSKKMEQNNYQLQDVKQLASFYLAEIGRERGISDYTQDARFYLEEQFNVIRGPKLVGKLFDVGIQITPGLIHGYEGVAR